MNKPVQILMMFCVLLPLCGSAKTEETLEERKQRIMRKYMRERAEVYQSDIYVPLGTAEEDEKVTESEAYDQTKDAFDRHEGGKAIRYPQRRMIPRKTESSNWLLDTTETDAASDPYADPFADSFSDPYADPFASDKTDTSASRRDWTQRDSSRQDSSSRDSRYESRYSSYGREQTRGRTSFFGSSSGTQEESAYGRSSYGSRDSSAYGTQSSRSYSSGMLGQQEARTYGSSPDAGLLTSPYSQYDSRDSGSSRDSGTQGYGTDRYRSYTPSYRSPSDYSTRQQQNTWGTSSSQSQEQQEYTTPSSFQKWKEKNKGFDPTSDNSYLNEISPSQSR